MRSWTPPKGRRRSAGCDPQHAGIGLRPAPPRLTGRVPLCTGEFPPARTPRALRVRPAVAGRAPPGLPAARPPATRLPRRSIAPPPGRPAARSPDRPVARSPHRPATRLPATRLPGRPITRQAVSPAARSLGRSVTLPSDYPASRSSACPIAETGYVIIRSPVADMRHTRLGPDVRRTRGNPRSKPTPAAHPRLDPTYAAHSRANPSFPSHPEQQQRISHMQHGGWAGCVRFRRTSPPRYSAPAGSPEKNPRGNWEEASRKKRAGKRAETSA